MKYLILNKNNYTMTQIKQSIILCTLATLTVGFKPPVLIDKTGITQPMGFFDPLKITSGKSKAELMRYRESEIKHGRVAMLSSVLILLQEKANSIPAIYEFKVMDFHHPSFKYFILGIIAMIEAYDIATHWKPPKGPMYMSELKEDYVPGNLFNFKEYNEDLRNKELNNGRLAMIGVVGMIAQELVTQRTLF